MIVNHGELNKGGNLLNYLFQGNRVHRGNSRNSGFEVITAIIGCNAPLAVCIFSAYLVIANSIGPENIDFCHFFSTFNDDEKLPDILSVHIPLGFFYFALSCLFLLERTIPKGGSSGLFARILFIFPMVALIFSTLYLSLQYETISDLKASTEKLEWLVSAIATATIACAWLESYMSVVKLIDDLNRED